MRCMPNTTAPSDQIASPRLRSEASRPPAPAPAPEPTPSAEESKLDRPITARLLMQYGLPTMLTLVVFNAFGILDGVFAARAVGVEALAAMSAFLPVFTLTSAVGILFASGASPIIVAKIGAGRPAEARRNFTAVVAISLGLMAAFVLFALLAPSALLDLLGVNYEIYDIARDYLRIAAWALPFVVIGQVFNQFLIADGKPILSMILTVTGAGLGVGLNAWFLFGLDWGMTGLAWATVIATVGPALVQVTVFVANKQGTIRFTVPSIDWRTLRRILMTGAAGFLPAAMGAVVVLVMNNVVARTLDIGAMGIAIAGAAMAMYGMLMQAFMGYAQGTGALIAFNHGQRNHARQKKLFRLNLRFQLTISLTAIVLANVFADLLMRIYFDAGTEFHTMAVQGLRIMSLAYLALGLGTLAVSQFAALGKGSIATGIAVVQTAVLQLPLLIILPRFWDLNGVWLAAPITAAAILALSLPLLVGNGRRYHYR